MLTLYLMRSTDAGKYRTWDFTIQVLEDKVFVTTDGPFTNNQGLAYVNWVND